MQKLNLPKTKEVINEYEKAAIMVGTWEEIWREKRKVIEETSKVEGYFGDFGWVLDEKGRVKDIIPIEEDEKEKEKREKKNIEILFKLVYQKKKEIINNQE